MAILSDSGYANLVNVTKTKGADGKYLAFAELLDKELEFLEDVPWIASNLEDGHEIANRTALPSTSAAWTAAGEGGPVVKSDGAKFKEVAGHMELYTAIDEMTMKQNGDSLEYRNREATAVIEAMSQSFAYGLWYESTLTSPKKIHGLSARYAATSGYTASNNVFKIGTCTTTGCHSVWLINWGERYVSGFYPKNMMAGLQRTDLGLQVETLSSGNKRRSWMEQFCWDCGILVHDWRYAARMQWDSDDTSGVSDSGKTFYQGLDRMLNKVRKVGPTARFYMDRTSMEKLTMQLGANAHSALEWKNIAGTPIPFYRGIPIRVTDSLVSESAIS